MAKKNKILKKYYTKHHLALKPKNLKERFLNFLKRHNFFKRMDKDIDCLELAEKVIRSFEPNKTIDNDPFLRRARLSLVNAIVFYLYFKRTPEDWDFVRIMNLLEKTKEEASLNVRPSSISLLYAKANTEEPTHTGYYELKVFTEAPSAAAHMVVDNILQNFKSPAECKILFQELRKP